MSTEYAPDAVVALIGDPACLEPASVAPETARALALNAAMMNMALEREGLAKASTADIRLLRAASLIELAGAAVLVRAHDAAQPPNANGGRTFHMACDDRLVAAIYAFVHYALPPASSPFEDDYPILTLTDTTHTYFLISGAREKRPEVDEEAD